MHVEAGGRHVVKHRQAGRQRLTERRRLEACKQTQAGRQAGRRTGTQKQAGRGEGRNACRQKQAKKQSLAGRQTS
jgi:hypothetical protein